VSFCDRVRRRAGGRITSSSALQAPGQVLLKLAATGFGVRLPGQR